MALKSWNVNLWACGAPPYQISQHCSYFTKRWWAGLPTLTFRPQARNTNTNYITIPIDIHLESSVESSYMRKEKRNKLRSVGWVFQLSDTHDQQPECIYCDVYKDIQLCSVWDFWNARICRQEHKQMAAYKGTHSKLYFWISGTVTLVQKSVSYLCKLVRVCVNVHLSVINADCSGIIFTIMEWSWLPGCESNVCIHLIAKFVL